MSDVFNQRTMEGCMIRKHVYRFGLSISLMMSSAASSYAAGCGFQLAFTRPDERGTQTVKVYRGDPVPALGNVRPLLFIVSHKVNTDGTKVSYGVKDPRGLLCRDQPNANSCAINHIGNAFNDPGRPVADFEAVRDAGFPPNKSWQVLDPSIIEKDKNTGKPCVTPDGYLVSMTAEVVNDGGHAHEGDCDQTKYIDALTVPAIVIPKGENQFAAADIGKRNIVVAFSSSATKNVVPSIVGDTGPSNELGEATVAMNRMLNGLPDAETPKHRDDAKARFQAKATATLIFPGGANRLARPVTPQRVAEGGNDKLAKFGGAEKVYQCIHDEINPNF
ncbi:glycoside hydrolase family 75 protein [Rhizobium leguminosarum]|uniref:glycoside hydrolase family 75 protein n=1 Tax=Rhizobium leguminosarum TaxID=384 RepID=UPI001C944CCF|nr:glycoside hydrolase family 75 protein [Rhizobium leguminosarum]MBY5825164.1 hypothetical protein [Rhizobium leguminosarum]